MNNQITLHHGDALDVLRTLPSDSIDAVVTDPPYGLAEHKPATIAAAMTAWCAGDRDHVPDGRGFMGRAWDGFVPPPAVWDECLRVLKPGGHLLAFAGSRTADLMGMSIRLAGFEMRDGIACWIYGSGFPKSLNVSRDKRFCQCDGDAVESTRDAKIADGSSAEHAVHDVSDTHVPAAGQAGGGDRPLLLAGVPESSAHGRGDQANAQVRGGQPGLEGRGDVQAAEGQLHRAALRPLPPGPDGDGAGGRLRDGTPARNGAVDRSPADADGVREPRRPESAEQRPVEPGAVSDERGPQTGRGRAVCRGCGKPRVALGLGTALKPAHEPIIVARKPLGGTVAATVLAHGTGALNIDGCRVAHGADVDLTRRQNQHADTAGMNGLGESGFRADHSQSLYAASGRWPSNVVLTHAPCCGPDEAPGECVDGCPVAELDAQSGYSKSPPVGSTCKPKPHRSGSMGGGIKRNAEPMANGHGDSGGASRFFPTFRYQAKASTKERPKVDGVAHPTVKPLALMRWLVRLVTPPGGTVLDPFAGSGTTLQAAREEGLSAVGVERAAEYLPLIAHRLGDGLEIAEVAPIVKSEVAPVVDPLARQILDAADEDALTALWEVHQKEWTDEHTALVRERLAAFEAAA